MKWLSLERRTVSNSIYYLVTSHRYRVACTRASIGRLRPILPTQRPRALQGACRPPVAFFPPTRSWRCCTRLATAIIDLVDGCPTAPPAYIPGVHILQHTHFTPRPWMDWLCSADACRTLRETSVQIEDLHCRTCHHFLQLSFSSHTTAILPTGPASPILPLQLRLPSRPMVPAAARIS